MIYEGYGGIFASPKEKRKEKIKNNIVVSLTIDFVKYIGTSLRKFPKILLICFIGFQILANVWPWYRNYCYGTLVTEEGLRAFEGFEILIPPTFLKQLEYMDGSVILAIIGTLVSYFVVYAILRLAFSGFRDEPAIWKAATVFAASWVLLICQIPAGLISCYLPIQILTILPEFEPLMVSSLLVSRFLQGAPRTSRSSGNGID